MTEEKLKREAKEYADKYGKSNFDLWDTARFAYYQGAEPREKQIAELKEDNSEWEKASDKWKSVYELTNNQLTKAKEIIKKFLLWENDWHNKTESKYQLLKEAEQFLK